MAAHQETCEETARSITSSSLQVEKVNVGDSSLLCDVARGKVRPIVPSQDRRAVFEAIHGVAHPGIRATRRMMSARYVWRGMSKNVAAWCRDCQDCQRGKVHRQPATPVQPIPIPAERFTHVHVDIVGPLPASEKGHVYLLTAIDRSTRWVEAMPLRNMEASTCADAFFAGWVARFGVPTQVTTDRGTQFTSATWTSMCSRLGITHILTTAYHPQSNGMVERVHRQIKAALRARGAANTWHLHLPWVLMGLRAAPKENSAVSSAELVLGAPLKMPGQLGDAPAQQQPPPSPRTYAAATNTPPRHLQDAQWVYLRKGGQQKPLAQPYAGPFRVLRRGAKTFSIAVGGRAEEVSVDRLKAHTGSSPVLPVDVVSRGRPRKTPAVQPATP